MDILLGLIVFLFCLFPCKALVLFYLASQFASAKRVFYRLHLSFVCLLDDRAYAPDDLVRMPSFT